MKSLILFSVIPLAASFLTALIGKRVRGAAPAVANAACLGLAAFSVWCLFAVRSAKVLSYALSGWPPPAGISVVVDGFSALMLVIVNTVGLFAMVYAVRYMEHYTDQWKFYSLFMLMVAGMNGVLISGDIFNLYVFLELASLSAYVLVSFGLQPEDLEASFKYAVMGALASVFILLGIALLYSYTSTLNMADMSGLLANQARTPLMALVAVLFLAGFGLKTALIPFHAWLPDAHSSAPAPVSAVLSGVFIKTLGVYALARIFFNVLGVSGGILSILMVLGVISAVAGAFLAIIQNDIKRMFAYSSISQIGYIIFALGLGTPLALLGAMLHIFNHAFFKSLLFLNAGAIEYATGRRDLRQLGGLNQKLPVTGFTGLLASMSISGVPPFGGFWSKFIIVLAAIQAWHVGYAGLLIVASIVTLAYYLRFQTFAYSGKLQPGCAQVKEVPLSMKSSMVVLAVVSVLAGLLLLPSVKPFIAAAADVLLSGHGYAAITPGVL